MVCYLRMLIDDKSSLLVIFPNAYIRQQHKEEGKIMRAKILTNSGLAIFAACLLVRFLIYEIPPIPTIIILCIAILLILAGAFLRRLR
jgi:O-antigen/teichoic acid export membrane protein